LLAKQTKNLSHLIGFSGDDSVYNAPYVDNSLVIFDSVAIAAIEQSAQKEISCGYRYKPVMTKGTYDGVEYDGVMTDIVGNHIAIVESGRAGSDVVVGDKNPFLEIDMSKKSAKIASAVLEGIKGNLAQDSKLALADIQKLVKTAMDAEKMDDDEKPPVAKDEKEQQDGESDEDYKARMEKMAKDKDSDDDKDDDKVSKTAMDSAIGAAVNAERQRQLAIRQAEKDVHHVVGDIVAQDSAEAVYKLALDAKGVDLTGVDKSAYRALFKAVCTVGETSKPKLAQDSAVSSGAFAELFPSAAKVKVRG